MIHTDEDDEFDRIAHEAKLKGQPYYFQDHTTDPDKLVYRKPSRIDDDDIQDYVRPWVGLTDKEIKAIAAPFGDSAIPMTGRMWIFVGDIEAKLKEKNT
jgi:hypothetical protein